MWTSGIALTLIGWGCEPVVHLEPPLDRTRSDGTECMPLHGSRADRISPQLVLLGRTDTFERNVYEIDPNRTDAQLVFEDVGSLSTYYTAAYDSGESLLNLIDGSLWITGLSDLPLTEQDIFASDRIALPNTGVPNLGDLQIAVNPSGTGAIIWSRGTGEAFGMFGRAIARSMGDVGGVKASCIWIDENRVLARVPDGRVGYHARLYEVDLQAPSMRLVLTEHIVDEWLPIGFVRDIAVVQDDQSGRVRIGSRVLNEDSVDPDRAATVVGDFVILEGDTELLVVDFSGTTLGAVPITGEVHFGDFDVSKDIQLIYSDGLELHILKVGENGAITTERLGSISD